jgi:hypothetical protein
MVAGARLTELMTSCSTSSGSFCNFHFICTGEVEMKVWMRPRRACFTASPARSISFMPARARPADRGVLDALGNGRDRLEIAIRGDGEARLDDVDAQFVEQVGHLQLFLKGHGRAGALLAVAQGGVENQNAVFGISHGSGLSTISLRPLAMQDITGQTAMIGQVSPASP